MRTAVLAFGSTLLLVACANASSHDTGARPAAQMKISSPAFADQQPIPAKYSCDGAGISPPLVFGDVPPTAKSLALIVDDPDAPKGTWNHWVVWNIPPATKSIAEGQRLGTTGRNGWARNEWGGPCPPDRQHRYIFTVYALDTAFKLDDSADKARLEKAMKGHVLATGKTVGVYDRRKK